MHGAVVNAAAIVGRNCIINSQALLEHDVVIGTTAHRHCCHHQQCVRIGSESFIGSIPVFGNITSVSAV